MATKTERLEIRLDLQLKQDLEKLADRYNVSVGEMARLSIQNQIKFFKSIEK